MATATVAKPVDKIWNGGVEPLKASYGKLMMWFFLLSDTFTFGATPPRPVFISTVAAIIPATWVP
jgi:heme/copper-type cytochrome/quinol oxidase subunit 3